MELTFLLSLTNTLFYFHFSASDFPTFAKYSRKKVRNLDVVRPGMLASPAFSFTLGLTGDCGEVSAAMTVAFSYLTRERRDFLILYRALQGFAPDLLHLLDAGWRLEHQLSGLS